LPRVKIAMRSPRLRRIIAAYTVNRLGTWFAVVALSVAVFDHTHSALAVAALLFAGQALPALVVPAVVARVEATAGRELSRLYLFEAAATAALAALLSSFWLPAVLLLVALDGTAALAASALLRTEVASAAREFSAAGAGDEGSDPERAANAALNTAFSATFVLGPALGGIVVAAAGASAALFIDVGSFLLGAALLANVRTLVEDISGESVRARLRGAWRHINSAAGLRRVLIAEFAALAFIETGGPIEVTFVKATLHAGDGGLGLLLTAWGVGAVVGSLIFARLLRTHLGLVLIAGTLSIAGAYFGLAAAPTLAVACVAGVLGGVGNGLQWPSLVSVVQRLTPKDLQGRLMGAVESLGALCLAVGLPLGGLLTALTSPRTAFVIVGAGASAATLGFVGLHLGAGPRALPSDATAVAAGGGRASIPPDPVGESTAH
jgi:MFS family permease